MNIIYIINNQDKQHSQYFTITTHNTKQNSFKNLTE